tara:strand:+ start:17275 stop:17409 length:135 start_codon:yes stop_codon:yes gene_type:complete
MSFNEFNSFSHFENLYLEKVTFDHANSSYQGHLLRYLFSGSISG